VGVGVGDGDGDGVVIAVEFAVAGVNEAEGADDADTADVGAIVDVAVSVAGVEQAHTSARVAASVSRRAPMTTDPINV
jgi:hypothetical protein